MNKVSCNLLLFFNFSNIKVFCVWVQIFLMDTEIMYFHKCIENSEHDKTVFRANVSYFKIPC